IGRFLVAARGDAALRTELLEPVDEFVAAHLADIHERNGLAFERCKRFDAGAQGGRGFRRRIAQHDARFHGWISLVTGFDSCRKRPPVQPAQIAENNPAWPPACTINRPSGQNLLTISSFRRRSTPSPTPCAPWITSAPGRTIAACSSRVMRSRSQPALR